MMPLFWKSLMRIRRRKTIEQCSILVYLGFLFVDVCHGAGYHRPPPYHGDMSNPGFLGGPAPTPPVYYQIDSSSKKLVQRQIPPGPTGITAAATNYLLQQLEVERQQQQNHQQRSMMLQQRQQQLSNLSPQQQTMQLIANLTPQQLAVLQTVIPTLPRSTQHVASSSNAAVAVLPPGPEGPHPPPYHHMPHGYPPQQSFASRMGPFDKLINKAKSWLPDMMSSGSAHQGGGAGGSAGSGGSGVGEPKMRDLHRLPKPPQYPLYDLPSIGQATPPPAPIMHPMASLPNSAFDLDQPQMGSSLQSSSPRSTGNNGFNQQNWISPSPTMSTSRRSRPSGPPRPPKPSKSSFLRNPLGRIHKKTRPNQEPQVNHNRRNNGPPPMRREPPPRSRSKYPPITNKPPKKGGPPRGRHPPSSSGSRRPPQQGPTSDPYDSSGPGNQMGFEHPMASNMAPAQSPSLGRPLSYEEYMARPSHSYTDDPWNFDPFANQMNQGLHTSALRYNYDPLGMNALDTEANSHLDPNKLSYPGDSFNQDMVKDSPGIGSTAQVGGWDKPYKKRPYNGGPDMDLTPPAEAGFGGSSPFSSSPSDPYGPPPPSSLGSFSGRYKDSGNSGSSGGHSGNTGFLGDSLSGGRRGEIPSSSDTMEGGSDMPSYTNDAGNGSDDAPTIDLETLSPSQSDDMDGLEFTIETSMGNKDEAPEESPQPGPHILGPMQPAASPYLSDHYSPYAEQSSPVASSLPGSPYGPNGFSQQDPRPERYGRRRTRNNFPGPHPTQRLSRRRGLPPPPSYIPVDLGEPEGVKIFNEIIRPQLSHDSTSRRHYHPSPNHAAVRKALYKAVRQASRK